MAKSREQKIKPLIFFPWSVFISFFVWCVIKVSLSDRTTKNVNSILKSVSDNFSESAITRVDAKTI